MKQSGPVEPGAVVNRPTSPLKGRQPAMLGHTDNTILLICRVTLNTGLVKCRTGERDRVGWDGHWLAGDSKFLPL